MKKFEVELACNRAACLYMFLINFSLAELL